MSVFRFQIESRLTRLNLPFLYRSPIMIWGFTCHNRFHRYVYIIILAASGNYGTREYTPRASFNTILIVYVSGGCVLIGPKMSMKYCMKAIIDKTK